MTLNLIELSAAKNEAVGRIRSVIDTSSSCEDKRLFIGWNGRKTAGHPWEFFVEIKRPDRYRSLYEIRAPNLKSENFLPGGAEIFRQFFVFFWPRFKWVVEQTSAWNGPVHWRSGAEHVRLLFSPRKKRSSDPIEWDRPPCNQNPGTHTLEPQKKKVFIYTSHKGTRHQSEAGRTSRDLEMEIFGRQKIKGFPGTRVPIGQKKKRGSHYQTKFPCSSAGTRDFSIFFGAQGGRVACLFVFMLFRQSDEPVVHFFFGLSSTDLPRTGWISFLFISTNCPQLKGKSRKYLF